MPLLMMIYSAVGGLLCYDFAGLKLRLGVARNSTISSAILLTTSVYKDDIELLMPIKISKIHI